MAERPEVLRVAAVPHPLMPERRPANGRHKAAGAAPTACGGVPPPDLHRLPPPPTPVQVADQTVYTEPEPQVAGLPRPLGEGVEVRAAVAGVPRSVEVAHLTGTEAIDLVKRADGA